MRRVQNTAGGPPLALQRPPPSEPQPGPPEIPPDCKASQCSPETAYLDPQKVCKIIALVAVILGLGLFFYMLLGLR